MRIATVSSKGQITLPAEARRKLGIKPHDRVFIRVSGKVIVVEPVGDFFELEGFLGKAASPAQERKALLDAVSRHVLELDEE